MNRRCCKNCRYWTETDKDRYGVWGLCEKHEMADGFGKSQKMPTQDEDECGLFDPKVKQPTVWNDKD